MKQMLATGLSLSQESLQSLSMIVMVDAALPGSLPTNTRTLDRQRASSLSHQEMAARLVFSVLSLTEELWA